MRKHFSVILLTLGLVGWFQEIFSIEWSSPYCSSQVDGPASAVWGMPLPYIRWSTVSSMEYFWMPTIFALDLLFLFAVVFPVVYWAVGKFVSPEQKLRGGLVSFIGWFLVVTFAAWTCLLIQTGVYKIPVSNIASKNIETYGEFRPVRFGFKALRYDCTPSDFWFPADWRPQ